jgi:exopolyphosphatase/guanosine-5'-triphosphate,3'-diphosphate pyrophosphatase
MPNQALDQHVPAISHSRQARRRPSKKGRFRHIFAAIDLGTNNCRLTVARPKGEHFKILDTFSRIVRLGEGVSLTGALGEDAMERAVDALKVCARKIRHGKVTRLRAIATQACRIATNRADFIKRVRDETGIVLDIVSGEEEAELAVRGCLPLVDPDAADTLIFDIGGGSTELMWVTRGEDGACEMCGWTSLPCGVVTLAERYGGLEVPPDVFEHMVAEVMSLLAPFQKNYGVRWRSPQAGHFLGTSGTVTTIAGVHLDLARYDRRLIDGRWLSLAEVDEVTRRLTTMCYEERAAHPCVGRERADLVIAGCAIVEAIARLWPCERLRVADRGLREGILYKLMIEADNEPRMKKASPPHHKIRPVAAGRS